MPRLVRGVFVRRPNRFTAVVRVGCRLVKAHVADSGRLGELLYEGNEVVLTPKEGGKFPYRVLAARLGGGWVLVDSGAHRWLSLIALQDIPYLSTFDSVESEVRLRDVRIDFRLDGYWLEVKGCTLIRDGVALFPDSPTERGLRQVRALKSVGEAGILFLVMAPARVQALNFDEDPRFSREVAESRLDLFAYSFEFDGEAVRPVGLVPTTRERDVGKALETLRRVEGFVADYNRRHGAEARYSVVEVDGDGFVLALTGSVWGSCCLHDYLEDPLYESGMDLEVSWWRGRKGHILARYRLLE